MNPLHAEINHLMPRPEPAPDGGWTTRLAFPRSFSGFAGHFPGHPVLPGVVQVMAAVHAASLVLGRPLRLRRLKRAKFARPVGPEEDITLTFTLPKDEDPATVSASLVTGGETAARLELELAP